MTNRPIFAIALYAMAGAAIILYVSWQHQVSLERETAIRAASSYSYAVSSIRKFYSDHIVPRAQEAGVAVSHEYRIRKGVIPFPATMSIDLGEAMMQESRGGAHYTLYSDYPFPWRNDRILDDFDREALAALNAKPDKPFTRVEVAAGGKRLRYATAVVLAAGCVECHNSHPDSPRKDWKVGDVRGVQQVIIPLADMSAISVKETALLALISGVGLLLIWFFMSQLQKSLKQTRAVAAISEKRNAELVVAKGEAERANAAKSRFMAQMSHELRTPLNSIIGFSDIIRHTGDLPNLRANVADYANDIHTSGTHLLELINEILDMSKIEAGMYEIREENVSVPGIVGTCLRLVTPAAEAKGVAIGKNMADDLPLLYADPRSMRQILLNLLSNAVKFTESGGRVAIAVDVDKTGCRMTVSDTGIGIPPDQLDEILEPFTQADNRLSREYEGTGLGLPITKALVELHGGTLAIESTLGQGTRVTIALPADRLRHEGLIGFEAARARAKA